MSFAKMIRLYNKLIDGEAGRTTIDIDFLLKKGSISDNYARQILSGSKSPTDKIKSLVIKASGIDPRHWELTPSAFGAAIGLTDYQIADVLNIEIVGINFRSQLKDKGQVQDIFSLTEGIFFSYYYSVSNFEKRMVCRDVFQVIRVDEFGHIRVRLADGFFDYSGLCVPIRNHLYYMLEKDRGLDEIVVYCTNFPNDHNRNLFGIILCNSVKLKNRQSSSFFPAASRVYFSFLGRTFEEASRAIGSPVSSFEDIRKYAGYIDETDPTTLGPTTMDDIKNINNLITSDKVPFALIAND
ncbi:MULTISPECIES: hypothetical protein [unclassified Bradyrhizobium]|uniref:hypothetical protein n=1 Tax=unclassified Bradyrhizobium TaxID=2631580 RepID=UPI0007096064|nr:MULTISPECIES: hypothetical protein [unclassified Bradyrhizobium]KQT21341.1 hypothetical protein ASG57_04265 [Bradyrhizobium sp. Leaf396]